MKTFQLIIKLKRYYFEAKSFTDALMIAQGAKRILKSNFILIEYDQNHRINTDTVFTYLPDSTEQLKKVS